MERACARAGRAAGSVKLLAVTKVFGPEAIFDAYALGLRDFGENYVQEMERKAPVVAGLTDARFHLIGHLQSNKTKKAAQLFASIDSIDSAKLALRLDSEATPLEAMIEVKLSDEESKTGADPAELPAIVDAMRACPNLKLTGLMTVPPWSEDAETARPYFAKLRELAALYAIPELSMGMSNDMEVAIEEGATWVKGGDRAVRPAPKIVTVGYHAPAPGSHSGVADYAEPLRIALSQLGRVESGAGKADVHLYHLGNNRLHEAIYARALATPGVVLLHDAVLHHFLLGTLSREEYVAEWVYNYGEWRRDLGEELWRERGRASADPRYFQFSMLRRIVERSQGVIVHNPGAAAIAREAGAKRVEIIPHFCAEDAMPDAADTARFRERLGIGQSARLFGMFGYLREPKRVLPCIRAFRRLHAAWRDTALLIAGEATSRDLERVLETEAAHPAVYRLGHMTEREFRIAGAAVDCCLNLRYPGVGETSGIAVRLMGMGKPAIVTDNVENSGFPTEAVLRVAPGIAESAELFDHMSLVTGFPQIAREIGGEARRHVAEHHSLERVAQRFWEVLCAASALSSSSAR